MRKKNIANAGVAVMLLLGLVGTVLFYQGTEAAPGAENPKKVSAENDMGPDGEPEDSMGDEKGMGKADSNGNTEKQDKEPEDISAKGEGGQKDTAKPSAADGKDKEKPKTQENTTPNGGNQPSGLTASGKKPSGQNQSKPSESSHTHSWSAKTTTVHHPATGHNEQVLVKDAWTETIPIYETVAIEVCNTCGADITENPREHVKKHMLAGEGGSAHTEYVQKQTGTETIAHPAEYETRWVQDSAAWDEEVTIGYTCSCGASK